MSAGPQHAIYLDYQATTPLAPEALDAMLPWLNDGHWNPHSAHAGGRRAAAAVAVARDQVASLLPAGGKLVFTSGATEAINLAIKGLLGPAPGPRNRIAVVATEHAAVLDTAQSLVDRGYAVDHLPVDNLGVVDLDVAGAVVRERTALVAAMLVNNEIGVIQPVEAIAAISHAAGALYLCDAVQGYGRTLVPANADMIAISAHKIHGPKGIGALWLRDGLALAPLIHGGGQEMGLRSGTLSPALCAGFGAAAVLAEQLGQADAGHVTALWRRAMELFARWTVNGSTSARYAGNLNIRRDGIDVARLMSDVRSVAFAAGSACASGSGRPSHVLSALGLDEAQVRSSIRLGFGRYTEVQALELAAALINDAAAMQGV